MKSRTKKIIAVSDKEKFLHDLISEILDYVDLRKNLIKDCIEYRKKKVEGARWEVLTDQQTNDIYLHLYSSSLRAPGSRSDVIGKELMTTLLNSSYVPTFHPIKDYFLNLKQDTSTDHIAALAATLEIATSDDMDSGSTMKKMWPHLFRTWLLNSVAMVLDNGNGAASHAMLVLTGAQGRGKTTWLNSLIPPSMTDYRYTGHLDMKDKDTKFLISERWLINIDDQLDDIQKNDYSRIKTLITSTDITVRGIYAKKHADNPRICSWAASVNNSQIFGDIENRRYLTLPLADVPHPINYEARNKINMDHVWAQALAEYRGGAKYQFGSLEFAIFNEINSSYFGQAKPEEEFLMQLFEACDRTNPAAEMLQLNEILTIISTRTNLRLSQAAMKIALDKQGFQCMRTKSAQHNNQVRTVYLVVRINTQPTLK